MISSPISSPIPLLSPSQSYSLVLIAAINTTAITEERASGIIIVGDSHKRRKQ
jgi:hypothetical protein